MSIRGSDRDEGAIAAAQANASRAGVGDDVELVVTPLSSAQPVGDRPGALIVNPPYGVRVGETRALRDLYAALGNVARERFGGWTVGLLSPGAQLETQLRLALEERFATSNGGIAVHLMVGHVAAR